MGTIKVDILEPRGTTTDITLLGSKFSGSTAGNLSVTGEGGTTQTNVQQGLVKAFCRFDGTSSGLLDSFNHGTLTDHGTGDHSITYTNNMANSNHTVTYLIGHNGGTGMLRLGNRDIATTGHGLVGTNPAQDSAQDMNRSGSMVTGDLA